MLSSLSLAPEEVMKQSVPACVSAEWINWKNWPWLLFHAQHIKGSLLYGIYRPGKFKVERREPRRILASTLTTHPSLCPQLRLWERGKGKTGSLCHFVPGITSGRGWKLLNEKPECGGFVSNDGPKLNCRKGKGWEGRKKCKGGRARSCSGTWVFSLRRWEALKRLSRKTM